MKTENVELILSEFDKLTEEKQKKALGEIRKLCETQHQQIPKGNTGHHEN